MISRTTPTVLTATAGLLRTADCNSATTTATVL